MARLTSNESSFATAVLTDLNAPVTDSNIQFIERWIAREGGGGANNPLNTTQQMSGSTTLLGNTAGVQNYGDLETGVQATVKTLLNGNFQDIVGALRAGNASEVDRNGGLARGLHAWSAGPNAPMNVGYTTVSGVQAQPTNAIGSAGSSAGGMSTGTGLGSQTGPRLDEQSLASEYGFADAFFKSDPELLNLIQQATAQQWTPQKFQAEFQATHWYQTHAQSARDFIALQTSDPATYNARLDQEMADVRNAAAQIGAQLDDGTLKQIATNALEFGWDSNQLQAALGSHVSAANPLGGAEDTLTQMRQFTNDMGISVSDPTMNNYLRGIQSGSMTMGDFQGYIRKLASSAFPGYSQQIDAGQTVKQIADPYIQDMASILELNPSNITLNDPTIRSMLTGRDAQGQPTQTGLWDFEQQLRQDPRWQYTKNATDQGYSMLRNIGQAWGFLS